MLKHFQVNEGIYLNLEQDIPPTARYISCFILPCQWRPTVHFFPRVAELCSCIELVSGEHASSQVLLTSDGRQMDPQDLIGKYSVGTVSLFFLDQCVVCGGNLCIYTIFVSLSQILNKKDEKPIFVFYRRYLGMSEPPAVLSRIPQRQLQNLTSYSNILIVLRAIHIRIFHRGISQGEVFSHEGVGENMYGEYCQLFLCSWQHKCCNLQLNFAADSWQRYMKNVIFIIRILPLPLSPCRICAYREIYECIRLAGLLCPMAEARVPSLSVLRMSVCIYLLC